MQLNAANILSIIRIGAVPILVVLLYFPGPLICLVAAFVFLVAVLTDLFDGFLARKFNQVTTAGKFLDPLADKLLSCSALVMLVNLNWAPAWAAVILICRELAVTGLRAVAAESGLVIAADRFGKLKTFAINTAVFLLILHYEWFGLDPVCPGLVILYLSLPLSLVSGANYLYGFWRKSVN